jgi:glycogen debranching enzyme
MADLYQALDREADAARLRQESDALRSRFLERFWWPEEATYFFGLDGRKRPIRSVVSNAGHALWSGIASADHARGVARRLLSSDMFSGWGIRTLSSLHPAYNPFGYQLGAVWPHDNSLIALGLRRYGFTEEALAVAEAIFSAAGFFQSYSLPELFAGLHRVPRAFPVQYREANVPQGWAAGSLFAFVSAMLGVRPDAPGGRLLIDPVLPAWLPRLRLANLTLGPARFDLEVFRDGAQTRYDVSVSEGSVNLVEQRWAVEEE